MSPSQSVSVIWSGIKNDFVSFFCTFQLSTASINLSGGNEKTTFFTSVGFNDQQGIIRTSGFQQTNLRAKFTHQLNKWFKLNLNLTGSYSRFDKVEESSTSLKVIRTAREEQPWIGAYRENGGYTVMSTELCRHNPVMLNEGVYLSPLIGVISKLRAATPCFLCTVQSSSLISITGLQRTDTAEPAHDDGIRQRIELLEQVAQHQRQAEQ